MDAREKCHLHTAMMLLETAAENSGGEFGTPSDYAWAAHSFVSLAVNGKHSWDGAEPMARRILDASGSDMTEQILA